MVNSKHLRTVFFRRLGLGFAWGALALFLIFTPLVQGQDLRGEEETLTSEGIDLQQESSEREDDPLSKDEVTGQEVIDPQVFKQLLPYTHYMNYQYQGDGSQFTSKDIIMEFMPDDQGVFQVAEFSDQSATAFIYQIKGDGLYELARFEHYDRVEDLRYSLDASDETTSLILPVDLSPGTTYLSGYQQEKQAKVMGRVQSVTIGQTNYQNVLVIEVADSHLLNQGLLRYYLADQYGLILIEQELADGSKSNIMYLNTVQGPLF